MDDQDGAFVGAYTQDVLFLKRARDALLTHPLINASAIQVDGVTSRLMAIATIGAIEAVLRRWSSREFSEAYFQKGSNEKKCWLCSTL